MGLRWGGSSERGLHRAGAHDDSGCAGARDPYSVSNAGGNTTAVRAAFVILDGKCDPTASHAAQSGSITITSVKAITVEGIYDLVFSGFSAGGRAVEGFIAPICNTAAWGAGKICSP